jgi:cell fate regulator YaaT (PSP1 superfamily)
MKVIIGVKFRKPGKVYFFDPGNIHVNIKSKVIVETTLGEELGEVVAKKKLLPNTKLTTPLKPIIRIANNKDLKHYEDNKKKEKEAFEVCESKIKKLGLDMNLTDVEYSFDNSKLLFYFTADGRIDFRELVKELAAIFKTRIELRQIGVRDEVKRIGGNGVCGRELCCCSFLNNFEAVSIKMAKEQNMSLNPAKISGSCGRLMCCLKYEQEVYEDKLSHLPKLGAIVQTDEGEGVVDSIETLKEIVKVKLKDDNDETYYKKYNASDLKIIKNISSEEVVDEEEKENLEELQKLEELEEQDRKNDKDEDIF